MCPMRWWSQTRGFSLTLTAMPMCGAVNSSIFFIAVECLSCVFFFFILQTPHIAAASTKKEKENTHWATSLRSPLDRDYLDIRSFLLFYYDRIRFFRFPLLFYISVIAASSLSAIVFSSLFFLARPPTFLGVIPANFHTKINLITFLLSNEYQTIHPHIEMKCRKPTNIASALCALRAKATACYRNHRMMWK